jgi:hypothetical protein
MGNLTTLSDLKTFLNINDTSEDSALNLVIPQVSAAMIEYLDKGAFGQTTYIEIYSGNGQADLVLNQRPVSSISSIYLDDAAYWGQAPGAFAPGTLLQEGVDYALIIDQPDGSSRCGMVRNLNGFWDVPFTYTPGIITPFVGPGNGNIKITYTTSANVPAQIQLACNMAIASIRNTAAYGQAISSESYEEYSVSLPTDGMRHIFTPEVRSLLARFRNVAIA